MVKSSIEVLTDFATRQKLRFWTATNYQKHNLVPSDPMSNTKYFVFEYEFDGCRYYYYAYDSFGTKGYSGVTYSGLFAGYSSEKVPELLMRPRFWVDMFLRGRLKTGVKEIDKRIVIKGTDADFVRGLLSRDVIAEFIRLYRKIPPIEFVVEDNYLRHIPDLHEKSIIGVKTNRWITREDELMALLEEGSRFLNQLKKKE